MTGKEIKSMSPKSRVSRLAQHMTVALAACQERNNETRKNRLNSIVDDINIIALPDYYVTVKGYPAKIYVYIFAGSSREVKPWAATQLHEAIIPKSLVWVAHEIFQSIGDGKFTIQKSRDRQTGILVDGEGNEQASNDQPGAV
jgi:hypothetical protein